MPEMNCALYPAYIIELVYRLFLVVKDFDKRVTGVHLFDVSVYVARLVPLAAEITL